MYPICKASLHFFLCIFWSLSELKRFCLLMSQWCHKNNSLHNPKGTLQHIYTYKVISTLKFVAIWVKMILLLLDCYNHQQQQVFHHTLEAPITSRNKVLHHTLETPITSGNKVLHHTLEAPITSGNKVLHHTLEAPITSGNKVLHHTLEAALTSNKVFIIHWKLGGSSISRTLSFYICKTSAMNL